MSRRRLVLAACLGGLVVSAAEPAASSPVDVEGTTYGGAGSGGWACGPNARAKYGGIGAQVRVSPNAKPDAGLGEEGINFVVGAAVEHRDFSLVDCGNQAGCDPAKTTLPPPGVAFGSAVKVGGDTRWFGIHAGVLVWQNWGSATDRTPSWLWFPELQLRLGRMDRFRGELGLGSYDAPTLLRPGAWAGIGVAPSPGWDLALRAGLATTSGAGTSGGFRGDLTLKIPVTDVLQVALGVALSQGLSEVDPEGRVMLIVHP